MTVTCLPARLCRSWAGRGLVWALSLGLIASAVPVSADSPQATSKGGPRIVDRATVLARLVESAQTREARVKLFQDALDAPAVKQRAQAMGVDAGRIRSAIPHLSDKDLADLAARASKAQDITAGYGGGPESTLVILGVVLVVVGAVILVALAEEDEYCDDYYDDCY